MIKRNKKTRLKISSFRKRGLLSISETGEKADVILILDGETLFSLKEKDALVVRRSSRLIKFARLEKTTFSKAYRKNSLLNDGYFPKSREIFEPHIARGRLTIKKHPTQSQRAIIKMNKYFD